MDSEAAISRIQRAFERMNAIYGRPVFDEIAVVALKKGGVRLLHYEGPREDAFLDDLPEDTVSLRKELGGQGTESGGEFNFAREAEGTAVDAYICLGPGVYLFCNHTSKTMQAITEDPQWLAAQEPFLNLSQAFAVDPVQAEG